MSYIAEKVWKNGEGIISVGEIIEDLKIARAKKDKDAEELLKNLLVRLGFKGDYPEFFL